MANPSDLPLQNPPLSCGPTALLFLTFVKLWLGPRNRDHALPSTFDELCSSNKSARCKLVNPCLYSRSMQHQWKKAKPTPLCNLLRRVSPSKLLRNSVATSLANNEGNV